MIRPAVESSQAKWRRRILLPHGWLDSRYALDQPSRIFAVGASAGSVEALKVLVRGLPADFPGALCVVLHISPHVAEPACSHIGPQQRSNGAGGGDGRPLRAGHIYIAVPDRRLLIDGEVMFDLADMPALLTQLAREPMTSLAAELMNSQPAEAAQGGEPRQPSQFSCLECHGVMVSCVKATSFAFAATRVTRIRCKHCSTRWVKTSTRIWRACSSSVHPPAPPRAPANWIYKHPSFFAAQSYSTYVNANYPATG